MLSIGAESFAFQIALQKYKNRDIQNCNVACCFVWVWGLSLTLRDEHRRRVFERRVLRRTFRLKMDEVRGGKKTK